MLHVEQAATGAEGLEKAQIAECAVIVLDMMLPDTDGLRFIDELKARRSTNLPSIIVITGASETLVPDALVEAPHRGLVSAVFRKPFDHAKLRETVKFCLTTWAQLRCAVGQLRWPREYGAARPCSLRADRFERDGCAVAHTRSAPLSYVGLCAESTSNRKEISS